MALWYDPGIYLTGTKRNKLKKLDTELVQQIVFTRLANLAQQRYHINGLSDTLSERTIIQSLLWYGSVVFFEKDGNLFALPGVPTGDGYNVYGDPGSAWVFSRYNGRMYKSVTLYIPGSDKAVFLKQLTGYQQTGKPAGVIVWDNKMRYPFINTVLYYTRCIADCYNTLDVTRYWLKRPLMLSGPEEASESVKKIIEDMGENPNAVYLSSKLGVTQNTQLLNTNANGQNLTDITGLLEWYESEFRAQCGIDSNSQMDKKGENLINAEITVNDQYQALSLDETLSEIQRGLDYVYEFFPQYFTEKPTVTKNEILEEDFIDKGDDNDDNIPDVPEKPSESD